MTSNRGLIGEAAGKRPRLAGPTEDQHPHAATLLMQPGAGSASRSSVHVRPRRAREPFRPERPSSFEIRVRTGVARLRAAATAVCAVLAFSTVATSPPGRPRQLRRTSPTIAPCIPGGSRTTVQRRRVAQLHRRHLRRPSIPPCPEPSICPVSPVSSPASSSAGHQQQLHAVARRRCARHVHDPRGHVGPSRRRCAPARQGRMAIYDELGSGPTSGRPPWPTRISTPYS